MRKGASRIDMKRVSAAPKERRCGVPCTLLVAAWSLFLLLLLTSSISHRDGQDQGFTVERPWRALFWSPTSRLILFGREDDHRHGDQHCFIDGLMDFKSGEHVERDKADNGIFPRFAALEKSAVDTQEVKGGRLDGRHDLVGESEDLSNLDSYSPPRVEGLHHSHSSGNEKDRPTSFDAGLRSTGIIFQEFGQPINALQYAEYGAGLLQKCGPSEEISKICLIRNPSGTHYRLISHGGEFPGQQCGGSQGLCQDQDLPCSNEFLAEEERCLDALRYGGDIVAELEPGQSYLVCQSDPLAGTIHCDVSCTSQSECLFSEADSNLCHYGGSIKDFFRQSYQGLGQLEASVAFPTEIPTIVVTEPLQSSSHGTIQNNVDPAPSERGAGSESDLDFSQQAVDTVREKPDEEGQKTPDSVLLIEVPIEDSMIDDHMLDSIDVDKLRKSDADEELPSRTKIELTVRESQVGLIHNALQMEDGTQERGSFNDEPLTPPAVHNKIQEEPRSLKRVGSVMSLDEYKKSILEKQQKGGNQVDLSSVQTRKIRHSDQSYNYAASSHGAKVHAANKEAYGANHILVSDKDKYLRNPCSAEDKYVVLELSEETFVDTIVISNFEFHSSNLKDFELFGSPVYPAKEWISLGKFQAENVRTRQKFNIEDPKLVRHLMLKMLTHWGSEFFCTLSIVEVFGVDVIENLLDDWIALDDNNARTGQGTNVHAASQNGSTIGGVKQQSDASEDDVNALEAPDSLFNQFAADLGTGSDQGGTGSHRDQDSKPGTTVDSTQEVVHGPGGKTAGAGPGGKTAGDSVLKILMQRVKALELNQTLFDLYLGDMNQKYKIMLSALDRDLALVTERLRNETVLTASLAMRLADMDLQRKEEKLHMEHRFAQIASNFTDNLDFMRWQIQSMERREITAIMLAFLCMILSALLHLLAHWFSRRTTIQDISVQTVREEIDSKLDSVSLSAVCRSTSTFVLYLASGLTILVLSV